MAADDSTIPDGHMASIARAGWTHVAGGTCVHTAGFSPLVMGPYGGTRSDQGMRQPWEVGDAGPKLA
jgi:hypothetical protein